MARIHAMKFYELAQAYSSFVRVGMDLVDELVWVNDFESARYAIERNIFPVIQAIGLTSDVLELRALYAVVLAYCGDHQAAANERSEEHTSELQSLMRISYAVFCLNKKKRPTTTTSYR